MSLTHQSNYILPVEPTRNVNAQGTSSFLRACKNPTHTWHQTEAWPAERIERLRHLRSVERLSNGQCARTLTVEFPHLPPISKNAVIGKCGREKIAGPGRQISNRNERMQRRIAPAVVAKANAQKARYIEHPTVVVIPVEQRKTFMQLERCQCHWPVGEPSSPDFYFCGAPLDEDRSYRPPYCAGHYRESIRV